MNPFRTGKLVLFQVTYDRDWHFFEIFFFVIIGIFGVGAAYLTFQPSKLTCVLPGALWRFRREVQSSSCGVQAQAPRWIPCLRSDGPGNRHGRFLVLQQVPAD